MEESIGKRIAANRKRLGLTQDALAERLGVTAQAVSKWENDQSCPDITTLPKLAEIFACTTDSLLGLEAAAGPIPDPPQAQEADFDTPEDPHCTNGTWEVTWDSGRRSSMGIALWLLIAGGLSLASAIGHWGVDLRHILWSSGVMVLGLFGLFRKFSVVSLGTFLFGGYFLLWHMHLLPEGLTIFRWDVVIPGTLLLFGLCMLVDSLRTPKRSSFLMSHNGKILAKSGSHCICDEDAFDCATTFGENHHLITLPRLARGCAALSFGELEVDLRGCDAFCDGCTVDLSCAFGELVLVLPKHCRAEPNISTAFAALDIEGAPAADAGTVIYVNGRASFGEITLRYL